MQEKTTERLQLFSGVVIQYWPDSHTNYRIFRTIESAHHYKTHPQSCLKKTTNKQKNNWKRTYISHTGI